MIHLNLQFLASNFFWGESFGQFLEVELFGRIFWGSFWEFKFSGQTPQVSLVTVSFPSHHPNLIMNIFYDDDEDEEDDADNEDDGDDGDEEEDENLLGRPGAFSRRRWSVE